MKEYKDYMYSSPMTDGEEIESFFNDIKVGDKVTVIGQSFLYGKGTVMEILDNCDKAVVRFSDGISYIPINDLKLA